MINRVSIKDDYAIARIIELIYKGDLDYSKKEKVASIGIAGLAAYFSWESSKFYLVVGGSGTKYLPIGTFSEKFGGQAAFWCNISLNWYFIMDTVIVARNAYYQYQLAKKLGVSPQLSKIVVKLGIAIVLAATTGVVFALIAAVTRSLYNEMITGSVNILLNYLGSIVIEVGLILLLSYIQKKLFKYCCQKASIEEETDPTPSAKWVGAQFENRTAALEALPNDSQRWAYLKTPDGFQNFILAPNQTTALLNATDQKTKSASGKMCSFILHMLMQAFDKIALYGYLVDTIKSIGELFKIKDANKIESGDSVFKNKNTILAGFLGFATFLPFGVLSSKVVFDTTRDIISLTKTATGNIIEFIEDPDWSKETFIKLALIIPAAVLATFGYFIAYISANTSLELNATYSWNDWWNIYPTCLGATAFNGWGFLGIIMTATVTLMGLALYSSEKREVLNRHRQATSFFSSDLGSGAVKRLTEEGSFGLSPLTSSQAEFGFYSV